jgi:hypothetical protein
MGLSRKRRLSLVALGAALVVLLAPSAAQADGSCTGFDYRVPQNRTVTITFRCTGTLTPAYVVQITSGPDHGVLGPIDPVTHQATYTPDPTYLGPDQITFTAIDGSSTPPTGIIGIEVTEAVQPPPPPPPPPGEGNCTYVVGDPHQNPDDDMDANKPDKKPKPTHPVNVRVSCPGTKDSPMSLSIVDQPTNGTARVEGKMHFEKKTGTWEGKIKYDPNKGSMSDDSFSFRTSDPVNGDGPINPVVITLRQLQDNGG